MILYPAIDLKDGACVRLYKGEMAQATVFNDDPAAQALAFTGAGCDWLHLVDLNGAFAGAPVNAAPVEAILKDTKQIHPCAVYLDGHYGHSDVVSGVPVALGAGGVEKLFEMTLSENQKKKFAKSVNSVKGMIDILKEKNFFD